MTKLTNVIVTDVNTQNQVLSANVGLLVNNDTEVQVKTPVVFQPGETLSRGVFYHIAAHPPLPAAFLQCAYRGEFENIDIPGQIDYYGFT